MADQLGPVPIPEPPTIREFPLRVDYGTAKEIEPMFYTHRFDAPGLKTEQRYYRGPGSRRFRVRKADLTCHEYETLRDHWNEARGAYARFPYKHPVNRTDFVTEIVRYPDSVLSFQHAAALMASDPGLTLISAEDAATPTYTSVQVDDGIPSQALLSALLASKQMIVPIVQIAPRATGATPIYLSDRRVSINNFICLPRLIDWSGLRQAANQNTDNATFRFGNADGVWAEYLKTVNLKRASIMLGFFHVDTRIMLQLWGGWVRSWSRDPATRVIEISAADGIYELNLPYPTRQLTRTCWKKFKSAWCPYSGPLTSCPKSWEACVERGMTHYFGGEIINAQQVHIKDNSTGTWGFGRSNIKSVTIGEDSIYQRVLQEIYTDLPMIINCDIAAGRDESEFYAAIGIIGEGPLTGFSTDLTKHLLDGSPCHDPQHSGGWRPSLGKDPVASNMEFFGISQAPWNQVPAGATFAAGTAFAEIRRTDEKGIQLSKVAERKMTVTVTGGMGGWTWTAPGNRQWTQPLTNMVWVAVNSYLRGFGMKADYSRPDLIPAATMESFLRLDKIIPAAAICDTVVNKLVGTGTERQFPFRGAMREQKPLRDWLEEILNCGLGYYYFLNLKLAIDIRINSSVLANNAFTRATVLENGFTAEPREAGFNHLTVEFGDEEYEWTLNSVQVYDIDHAEIEGSVNAPRFKATRLPLPGVSGKSQASRVAMVRLKEELGGGTTAEQDAARSVRLRSTLIALATLPGDVGSFDDASLPGGRIEFRITSRTINPDFSMDFEGVPSTDSMYNEAIGPKPDDVPAELPPPERFPSPQGLVWLANTVQPFDGDPMYPTDEWTFALWQDYSISRTGTWDAALWVEGETVVNTFQGADAPLIFSLTFTTGGTLPGGFVYYVAVAQRDDVWGGHHSPVSNIAAIWVPVGLSVKLTIGHTVPVPGFSGYAVYMGTDIRKMCKQIDSTNTPLPSSVEIDVHYKQTDPMPWGEARKIRTKAKRVHHSGVAGLEVQQVIGNNQIRSSEWIGSTDNWVNQYMSVVADWSDGSVPLWNFRITAFNPSTGTMTVDPPCVRTDGSGNPDPANSVEQQDVMIVRARVTAATETTVTCALWRNSIAQVQFGADGLEPDAEIGLMIRVLTGKGKGQTRLVTTNTRDTHTIDVPWDVIPDSTSVIIVEDPAWVYTSETSTPSVSVGLQHVSIRTRVANLADKVVLVGGFLVDDQELETLDELALVREVYVYGNPPPVIEDSVIPQGRAADDPLQLTVQDQTVRIKTETGQTKVALLPPHDAYFGRRLYIVPEGGGKVLLKSVDAPLSNGEMEIEISEETGGIEVTSA